VVQGTRYFKEDGQVMATVLKKDFDDASRELDDSEAKELFEAAVQKRLGISTEEFLKKFDAGQFKDREEDPLLVRLFSLLPLVR
jgi:hypothetical protein